MNNIFKDIKTFFRTIIQLQRLLSHKQRIRAIGVFFLTFLGAAFETLGVAAILPFISAIMSPSVLRENQYIKWVISSFTIENDNNLIVFLGIIISIVYLFKNVFLIFVSYAEAKFRTSFVYELSKMMMHSYLKRPYVYFLDTNSAEMMRGITDDINSASELIAAIFKICSVCLMIIGIGFFLIFQDPFMATGIMILALTMFAIIVLTVKKKTKELGILKLELATKANKYAYQAFNGIKEITIMKREDYFLRSYIDVTAKKKKADVTYACISTSPERIIEAVFLTGIIALVCFQVETGKLSASFIPNLATFAIGAMRILPSLSTLTTRMTQIMYLRPALAGICDNVEAARKQELQILKNQNKANISDKSISFKDTISLNNVSWKYPNSTVHILENASMEIKRGESVALVGKSGAGKTTLADIILGLLEPELGSALLDGVDIFSIPQSWCKLIGYVPQTVYLIDDTIRNNVSFGIPSEEVMDIQIWNALEKAQLRNFVESLPEQLDTVIGERGVKFSGGQRQRVAIARALYQDPEILIFDEATAALDSETEQAVMEAIDALQGHKTLIIIAHRLNTIRQCDRFFEVEDKKIIEKSKDEVLGLC
ncbi:MAG: ABC transporter ATP-binding protein/permease [Anaeroplasmataceae bacterium]|nr:ABC transporter ATP-binding protein/permease [Anaeroplasmataceae bacterium]